MDVISYSQGAKALKEANGKVQHYSQEAEPINTQVGDEWYVPSVNVTYKRINAGSINVWVDISTAGGSSGGLLEEDLKTINGESIVGAGDITVNGGTLIPELSSNTVSQNEEASTEVIITNYDANLTYVVESLDETVATVSRTDAVLTITGSSVTVDGSTTVRVNATASGVATSEWAEITATTLFVNSEADGVLVNANLDVNGTLVNMSATAGGVEATANSAVYLEDIQEQGAEEGDWIQFNNTSLDYKLPEITVESDSTNTALKSFEALVQGTAVRLYNSTDGLVDGSLGSVSTAGGSTVNTHDIFGDGSAVATYTLDGDANDLGGNYNGTATSSISYIAGKFGQCAVFDGTYQIQLGQIAHTIYTTDMTVSVWLYSTSNGINNYAFAFAQGASSTTSRRNGFWITKHKILAVGTDEAYYEIPYSLPLNTWTNVVYHKSGSSLSLYINGSLLNSISMTSEVNMDGTYSTNDVVIGGHKNTEGTNNSYIDGSIDQVRIFNRALTPAEVTTLYNEQVTKYTADISSLSLTQAPTKAMLDKGTPEMYIDVAADTESIDMDANGVQLVSVSDTYDGTKFTAVHKDYTKQGRAVQRKVVADEGVELLDGMSTDLVKLGD
jgi:uncharacterized Zn-binding protein involved in type VI secretion